MRVTTPNETVFGSYCQKKQTEHSIEPVSSALFSYRYDSLRQTVYRRLWHTCLYGMSDVFHLTQLCRLRLAWSREHALWTPQQWSFDVFRRVRLSCSLILGLSYGSARYPLPPREHH
ncbi:hypothetical protein AVEN_214592-1 [Araneus ventricosus]|uniref:Uncharacterized protein n=1 Tax=Araneus ventricosus TaxID=182803 RepID=A0A4Y2IC28_ARAVE|nr:hypothetical protein AVEN_214592-1 [Araneus ventricosus]